MTRIIAVIILLLLPLAMHAQVQAPANIIPKPAAATPKKPIAEVITQKTLEAPRLDSIGILDTEGKLGGDIWKGSRAEDILLLLDRQNLTVPSPAAHALLTRLLVTPAVLENKEEGVWLRMRLQILSKMGEEKAVKDMLTMIPSDGRGEYVDRLLVEQEMLKLNYAKACEKVVQGIGRYQEAFWLQANIFCLARNKKSAEADLALQVLREKASEEKSSFPLEDAIRKILGDAAKIQPLKTFSLSPLELSIAIEAGLAFDPQINKENGDVTPAVARFLALNSKLSVSTRTQLAERAFRMGILPREQLAELYKTASFKPEAYSKAVEEKQFPADPVEARALAFQLVEKTPALSADLRKQFAPDLAQRLFSPDVSADGWRKLAVEKNILVAAVHKAFGLPVDKAVWKNFAAQSESAMGANKAALDLLKEAASAKHVGETALRGLSLMRYSKNSVTLAAVLEAFRTVGLEKEASALAGEALLSNE